LHIIWGVKSVLVRNGYQDICCPS